MTTTMKLATALGLAVALALGATTASLAQNPYSYRDNGCIPQYDSSGAQKAPYC